MRLVLFAGPSGGHLFPALAFAEAFAEAHEDARIHLVTSLRGKRILDHLRTPCLCAIEYWSEFPMPRGFSFESLAFLVKLPPVFGLSYRFLSRINPDLAVGFGSYVSFPGMMMSAWMKIPTLIHEQNQVPGKATEWLAPHMQCAAVSFESTFLERGLKRREVTGLPLRWALRASAGKHKRAKAASFENRPLNLLIVGGSQGSRRLNQVIFETFSQLSREELMKLAVNHVTGEADFEIVSDQYKTMNLQSQTYPFCREMQDIYRNADVAITRAGANTLFELALFGIPAIVIPYPHAGAHQEENARAFAEKDAVIFKTEDTLTPEWLADELRALLNRPEKRELLGSNIRGFAPGDAEKHLVEIAERLMGEKACEPYAKI